MCLARISASTVCLLLIASVAGCSGKESVSKAVDSAAPTTSSTTEPFELGDLVKPFTPPPLAELDKTAHWQNQPVVDALARLRAYKKEHEPQLVSLKEALSMRNTSPEANRKILSALSVLAPESGTGVDYNAPISRGLIMDISTTNPILINSIAEFQVTGLTGFGLFGFDWNMMPFATTDTVVSWQTSQDHMMDKVVMRDDLSWSDGKPITAYDVEFSFKTIMSSKVPVPAMRSGADQLRWVQAYDDHTVVFFHKAALATGVWDVNFSIIPKHIYEKSIAEDPTLTTSAYHVRQELHPVVGGPYELAKWSRGSEIVLRRRDSYFMHNGKQVRDKPYFKEIRFHIIEDGNTRLLALKSGRIDEGELEAEQWETQTSGNDFYAKNTKAYGNEWLYFYIGWNLKTPFFQDVRVRRAMAYTMNYKEMINDLCYGLYPRCHGIFAPDAWMYPKHPLPLYHQDLDKAEQLLDEAGWVDSDGDGIRDKEVNGQRIPFEFDLMVAQKPDRVDICNLFREYLDSIGILCHVVPLESAVLIERIQNKKFEAEMGGWGTGTDPYLEENIFGTGKERNFGSYSNPKVDQLFKLGMKEFDPAKRAEIYGQIANLIYEDQPYMFLYDQNSFYGFSKSLRGYRFSPRGPYDYSPGFGSLWMPVHY
ncbi:MAG TPA: ABC transporter substrate-binding protein [Lacipirellulaceae bacterium]|nr:ABC transporter substrate-binding protein [Lacipirellulaceae bacterium]